MWHHRVFLTRADVVARASVRSFPASIWRGNLSWQWHEPQIVRRWPECGRGSSSRRRGLGLPHHQRCLASWARAVHVVLAQGMSELMSIFITTSKALLSSTVAWWPGTPKKLGHARPGCSAR
jgi:hypothetical protein